MISHDDIKQIELLIQDAIAAHYMVQKKWEKQHLNWHETISATLEHVSNLLDTSIQKTPEPPDKQVPLI